MATQAGKTAVHWSWGKDLTIINFTSRSWSPFLTCFIQVVLSFLIFPSFLLFTQKTFSAKRRHQTGQSLIILIIIYKSLINHFGLALVVLAYFLQPLNLILFNANIFLIQVLPSSTTLLPYLRYWLHFSQFWSKNTCCVFSFTFIACLLLVNLLFASFITKWYKIALCPLKDLCWLDAKLCFAYTVSTGVLRCMVSYIIFGDNRFLNSFWQPLWNIDKKH